VTKIAINYDAIRQSMYNFLLFTIHISPSCGVSKNLPDIGRKLRFLCSILCFIQRARRNFAVKICVRKRECSVTQAVKWFW